MKVLAVLFTGGLLSVVATFGQGQFVFNNRVVPDVNARFILCSDAGQSSIGTDYTIQLFNLAKSGGTLVALDPSSTTFRGPAASALAGYVNPTTESVPGVESGETANIILRLSGPGLPRGYEDFGPFEVTLGGGALNPPPTLPLGTNSMPAACMVGQAQFLTNADSAAFSQAVQAGGRVGLAFNGKVQITNALLIAKNTTVDATGWAVSLDGRGVASHFVVTNSATLRLVNLTLENGQSLRAVGGSDGGANSAKGGSIFSSGGTLDLIQCRVVNNQAAAFGGAIYSTNGTLKASDCDFADNRVTDGNGESATLAQTSQNGNPAMGGAIFSSAGTLDLVRCNLISNQALAGAGGDAFGGAIFSTKGVVHLEGVAFSNNVTRAGQMSRGTPAGDGGQSYGGAYADVDGTTLVTNCLFIANHAWGETSTGADSGSAYGGAVYHDGGIATIVQTFLSSNTVLGGGGISQGLVGSEAANGKGGAIFNRAGQLDLRNSTLFSNKAYGGTASNLLSGQLGGVSGVGNGGAIYNESLLTLVNCTLVDNGAVGGRAVPSVGVSSGSANGGALFNDAGTVSLLNVTVANNTVQIDPSGAVLPSNAARALGASLYARTGAVHLTNTIVSCAASQTNVFGTIIDGDHNICSDASAGFTLLSSRNSLDPLLAEFGAHGGPTPTVALLPESPAIDAGDDAMCPPLDQRGVGRTIRASDIGSFEYVPELRISRNSEGAVRISYGSEPGLVCRIRVSADLINSAVLTAQSTDSTGLLTFEDQTSDPSARRFYQSQLAP